MIYCPKIPYFALYFITSAFLNFNIKGATHWRVVEENGVSKIIGGEAGKELLEGDVFLSILTKRLQHPVAMKGDFDSGKVASSVALSENSSEEEVLAGHTALDLFHHHELSCGPPVNETGFDHLPGIMKRREHPPYAEPEVALVFKRNEFDDPDLESIENNLSEAVKQGENKVILYNQVGNFLRIRGNTYQSIECFRKALAISPTNADVLLNLARILLNLNYLEDAIYLTQKSLEMQPPDHNCWLQHFTLGEILKSKGDIEQASTHFRNALDLNPAFHPAELHLRELGETRESAVDYNTLLLIGLLCSSVVPFIYYTVISDTNTKDRRRVLEKKMRCK